MQKDLEALEQRWGMALQSASFGVWDLDPIAQRVHYSPEWKAALGYGRTDEADDTAVWQGRVHPDDLPHMRATLGAHLQGGSEQYAAEFRLRAADGSYRHVLSRGRVVKRDATGQALRVVGTLTDLTDRYEFALMRAQRDSAEAANLAKTEFLSRMSHELRTPLNAVLGFAQLLQQRLGQGDIEAQRRYVSHIEQAGWHLLALINDVLDLSRVESGQLAMHIETVPLASAWQAASAMLAPLATARGVQVGIGALPPGAAVRADPVRLRQVLGNLLSNAVKYNRRGGQVSLNVQACAGAGTGTDAWQVSLHDTGIGIAAAKMPSLFEPFNRLGHAQQGSGRVSGGLSEGISGGINVAQGQRGAEGLQDAADPQENEGVDGVGIGLVLTRWLLQRMGGDVTLSSIEGVGTTATFTLPAAPATQA